ncbi:shikimate kinase [Microbacterium foliorum]|uniref:Shikimate kinase n=1 Tax=Microbacterium foliorum TaxID=104336 RepID=A0ABU1HRY6_9MICO|nr:hypothetical protein [Microbacterium foliorum]MDR6142403.1 shikimate kinase [Microbacterium foliorum]
MDRSVLPLVVAIIVGPQASGKSTLATAVSAELRRRGERVALVALDQIAEMALPTLPSWDTAHQIFETVVGHWARAELTCVIAEGSGSKDEVERVRRQLPLETAAVTIATTATFDTAIERAQADPTRGVSKERDFLKRIYKQWDSELRRLDPDLTIDTGIHPIADGVQYVAKAVEDRRRTRA